MGTNYYYYEKEACACCGRPFYPIHIGKSSGGWCFIMHIIPEKNINTLDDWIMLFNVTGSYITDEYNKKISITEMLEIIKVRSWTFNVKHNENFHIMNHSEDGPNNLCRCKIDGEHCVGHGEGTWDYIIGEFS